ncbi:ABC transporter permease [Ammoniphilus sp. YIM 78166]|uniref:ABC transporter permease n=1 Tax=Ammoniphilus sp. YIM 78166 TaxID=1644106 RepID=UPI00106F2734|nr:ABC transporter permease [Ammoniphilus sp. YIM 78166]
MKLSEMILDEWREIMKDKRLLIVLFLIPISYMFVFGSMYHHGQVQNLPTIYIDESDSQLSKQIIQAFETSFSFQVMGAVSTEKELIHLIETGQAAVGLVFPEDLSANIKQGKQSELLTFIDGSNMMVSNIALRNANEIIQTFSGGISLRRLEAKGIDDTQAVSIHQSYRILYNPGFSYGIFLLVGLFGAVIQQVLFLGISLSITREKERARWSSYVKEYPWKVLYAKAVPYFLIGVFNILMTYGLLLRLFHIPLLGSIIDFLALSVAFILSLLGIGFLASLTAKTQLQATQVTMLIALPSFLLSGFTWPFSAMPSWVAAIGQALPLTYFLHGMREVAVKGNAWDQISNDIFILAMMAFTTFILAILILLVQRKQLIYGKEESNTNGILPPTDCPNYRNL